MRSVSEKRMQRTVALICATLFVAFSFTYISLYKAPLLEALYDHVATGKLDYNPYIAATIITATLTTLAIWLNRLLKFQREWTALAYLPSCILLAFITDINRGIYTNEGDLLPWLFIFFSVALFNLLISFILRRILFAKIKDYNLESNRLVWRNMVIFALMFMLTGFLSDGEKDFNYESAAYVEYKHGNIDAALNVAKDCSSASQELTASRAFYLALQNKMGDNLFNYPQHFASGGLLLPVQRTTPLSPDSIYAILGIERKSKETVFECLQRNVRNDSVPNIVKDYYLCALLLEKRILQFKEELSHYYNIENVDSLPTHYKEALLLYNYVVNDGEQIVDTTLQHKFDAMRILSKQGNRMKKSSADEELRRTYWWYYLYE